MFSFIPSSLHYYVAKIGKIFVHIYSYYRGRRFFVAYPAGFSSFCDSFFFYPKKKGGGGSPFLENTFSQTPTVEGVTVRNTAFFLSGN